MLDPSCISLESRGEHQTGTCVVSSPGDIGKHCPKFRSDHIVDLSLRLLLGRKVCSKSQPGDF